MHNGSTYTNMAVPATELAAAEHRGAKQARRLLTGDLSCWLVVQAGPTAGLASEVAVGRGLAM